MSCLCLGDRWPAGALQLLPSPEALVDKERVATEKQLTAAGRYSEALGC